jgi:DNA polymerase elongation subunit (family B)
MSRFYTSVCVYGKNVLYRGYENGKQITDRVEYHPTLFVPSTNDTSIHRSLDGHLLEPVQPGNIPDCRDFVEKYKGINGFRIFGNTDYIYPFIADKFPADIEYDMSQIGIANIDIETECEYGFPQVDDPEEKVIAISMLMRGKMNVFCLGEFETDRKDITVHTAFTEEEMLQRFIHHWQSDFPDIVTGWNVKFFDIPYLVNRIKRVLGETEAKKISPWNKIKEKTITKMGREQTAFFINGVAIIDYLDLYKSFTYTNQESYRLDHIAFVELGKKKLSYAEYDSIREFYKNDFQKFIEYNIVDVELVQQLEEKLKLIELSLALAYSAKVNFEDVFSQVRTWDAIIYHYLREQNIVIPPKTIGKKTDQYAGAYVKEPITGMHDWVVSFDLNSLYPHLIEMYNISPETLTDDGIWRGLDVDKILDKTPDTLAYIEKHKSKNLSVAATGNTFRTDAKGFLPSLMNKMYAERKEFKNKMIECQKQKEKDPTNKDLDYQIAKFHNFQQVRKIQLNSAYGAIGNQYFRYYSTELAESITLSGQLSIRWIMNALNEFLNTTLETTNYDYVVASDTDSVYLRLGNLVDRILPDCDDKDKITNFLDKSSKEIIIPFIKKKYDELSSLMNAYENKMVMDREVIADKGIWTAKKRYMLNVIDSEGVRYETPKMKIMGIETTRSSTPQIIRSELKKAIKIIMYDDEETMQKFIADFREEFNTFDVETVAFPRGVNNLSTYKDSTHIYIKSTPIGVKGSLLYNHYLRKKKLEKKYPIIQEGDKIKFVYLKVPNLIGDRVVAFPSTLPKEFDLDRFVDYNTQFEKGFLDPLSKIMTVIGWSTEKQNTLESLFG